MGCCVSSITNKDDTVMNENIKVLNDVYVHSLENLPGHCSVASQADSPPASTMLVQHSNTGPDTPATYPESDHEASGKEASIKLPQIIRRSQKISFTDLYREIPTDLDYPSFKAAEAYFVSHKGVRSRTWEGYRALHVLNRHLMVLEMKERREFLGACTKVLLGDNTDWRDIDAIVDDDEVVNGQDVEEALKEMPECFATHPCVFTKVDGRWQDVDDINWRDVERRANAFIHRRPQK